MSEHDGIHGTNGARGPTEAEHRAALALTAKMEEWHGAGPAYGEALDYVRTVIRSLIPATDEMIAAGTRKDPMGIIVDFAAMIDAASPEIKP